MRSTNKLGWREKKNTSKGKSVPIQTLVRTKTPSKTTHKQKHQPKRIDAGIYKWHTTCIPLRQHRNRHPQTKTKPPICNQPAAARDNQPPHNIFFFFFSMCAYEKLLKVGKFLKKKKRLTKCLYQGIPKRPSLSVNARSAIISLSFSSLTFKWSIFHVFQPLLASISWIITFQLFYTLENLFHIEPLQ